MARKRFSPKPQDPAVLFVSVGWAKKYDTKTTIKGGHGFLQSNGNDCSEMGMYLRLKDKMHHCGVGRGKIPHWCFDVVFVAKHPPTQTHRVVAIYFDATSYLADNPPNFFYARAESILPLLGKARCEIKWPTGQGVRRWAWRSGAPGREHPELYQEYRSLLELHGRNSAV